MDKKTIKWNNYPYTGKAAVVEYYKFDEKTIDKYVPEGVMPGNYKIGRLKDGVFTIIYVGRVDHRQDEGLRDRLKEHIGEWNGDLWFDWAKAKDVKAAYEQECTDFHLWGGAKHLENDKHPRKPDGKTGMNCPICGE